MILSAVYLLWLVQRVLFGEVDKQENAKLEDMDLREKFAIIPLVAMAVVMGIAPMLILRTTEKSVNLVKEAVIGKPAKVAVVPAPAGDHTDSGLGK